MGVLAPLYLAGLAALSLPLIFHLVRRTPRGRQEFSSLMFLLPSPPRLTRRSRIDQILLLLLRLAALALLAFAFARPFLREAATLALEDLPARRVAILVDTSASMRRGDLWQQALRQVEKELSELGPHDEIALYTFDERLHTQVGFDAVAAEASASRVEIVRQAAKKLQPTWYSTDLGGALAAVASELDAASDVRQHAAEPQVIAISDFAKGSRIDALHGFEWPKNVQALYRRLTVKQPTNAFPQLLTGEEESGPAELRVRVASAPDSKDDQFFIGWTRAGVKLAEADETAVYVPPGQSRVVKLPRPDDNLQADRILLRGDDHDFDNTFFVVPPRKQQVKLVYFGSGDADDQQSPQYYLKLAITGDPLRQVELESPAQDDATLLSRQPPPQLVVVTRKATLALLAALKEYLERGGTLILAPQDNAVAAQLPELLPGVSLAANPPASGEYLLLGEIDFANPLFVPFANPRYSEFTKIHFWKHRPLAVAEDSSARMVAKFDNGEPAIIEQAIGRGRAIVLASGWQPDESQLALSTKFVPLVGAMLDQACGTTEALASVTVGQSVELPPGLSGTVIVQKPDGSEIRLSSDPSALSPQPSALALTDQPGIYKISSGPDEQRFAVNLAVAESNTAPLELEQFEQLGIKPASSLTRNEQLDRIRQQRDTELESRQKVWRWLLVGALAVLVLETFWAGRATRQIAKAESVA